MFNNLIYFHPCNFNEELINLPNETKIINLTSSWNFNKKIDILPQNLLFLLLDGEFNQKVDKLPKNLTHLSFDGFFNQTLDKLPKNLTHLRLPERYNNKLNNLPKNLIYLDLGQNFSNNIIIPKSLTKLMLCIDNNLINNLPEHIEKIYVRFYDERNYYTKTLNKNIDNLPTTLKKIVITLEEQKKYFIKIPFGTKIIVKFFNYIENYSLKLLK